MSDGPAAVIVDSTGANIAEVKPASTAAVAADKALVVAVSPNNTVPVSAATLPLPTGAATSANQTTLGSQTTKLNDGTNTAAVTAANALKVDGSAVTQPVSAASLPLPTGAATAALQTQPGVDIGDVTVNNGAGAGAVNIQDGGNSITVDATALPLPTGAATETTLAAINTKTPALGQATMAASSPVVIASNQTVIPVNDNGGSLTVDGTVTANAGTGPWPVTDNGGSLTVDTPQLPAALVGGRLDVVVGAALPAGTNNIGDVDVLSVPAPLSTTGGGTEATALRVTVANDSTGVLSVDDNAGSLTTDTPQLPAALVAGRLDTNVGAWLGSTAPTVGQKMRSASVPVTLASDQPAIPVTFTEVNARTGVSSGGLTLGGSTAGTLQVVRATPYTEPASAAQRSIASSSANDAAAGTGARTVAVYYFDGSGDGPFIETLTLNGTTPVNTVATNIRFIEKMEVETVGSLGANAGTITLYGATGGTGGTVGSIGFGTLLSGVGDNRTRWAHHYVATDWIGKTAVFVVAVQSGGSGTSGKFYISARKPLVANSAEVVRDGGLLITGTFTRQLQYPSETDGVFVQLTAYAIPGVNNTEVSATFDWSETPV